jgi:endonuclease III
MTVADLKLAEAAKQREQQEKESRRVAEESKRLFDEKVQTEAEDFVNLCVIDTFPEEEWADLHLRIIYFGREYCPAKGHDPQKCPICSVIGRKELFK